MDPQHRASWAGVRGGDYLTVSTFAQWGQLSDGEAHYLGCSLAGSIADGRRTGTSKHSFCTCGVGGPELS